MIKNFFIYLVGIILLLGIVRCTNFQTSFNRIDELLIKALEELKDNLEIQTGKAPKADESGTKTPQVTSGNESVTPEIRVSPTDSTGVTA